MLKRTLPFALIVMGTMALSGCLFIPAFNHVDRGINVADKVGPANSKRPIRIGNITMPQAMAILGPPEFASDDGRRIAYTWDVINGYWILPICFGAQTQRGKRGIELTFDSSDVLRNYEIKKLDGSLNLWPEAIVDMRRMFPDLHPAYRFRTTQSSTRPAMP